MRARPLIAAAIAMAAAIASAQAGTPQKGAAIAAPPIPMTSDAAWCLKPATAPLVAFRGVEEADPHSLGQGGMLYVAPSAAAAVAEVIAHAIVVGGVRSKMEHDRAAAANKVLEPYQSVLGSFKSEELRERMLDGRASQGSKPLVCGGNEGASVWTVDSAPVFAMTQDQTGLVVDNVVSMHPPGTPGATLYRHSVRVVAARAVAEDPVAMWTADAGARLKGESVALYGESMDIAFRVAAGEPVPSGAPFKTFRYNEGGAEKIERAQLVSESCGRLLLKTLRGEFWSVPTTPHMDCAAGAQKPPDMPPRPQ